MTGAAAALLGAGLAPWAAGMAGAQGLPVSGKAAKAMLFSPKHAEMRLIDHDFLAPADKQALKLLPRIMKQQQMPMKYYGAIAVAPSAGLLARETTLFAMGHHSAEAARAAALGGCEAARKGGRPCVIVAEVYPRGWKPRVLQLNQDATRGFRKYRRARGPKAFAASPSTGHWAFARGNGAAAEALARCNAEAGGAGDCRVVIRD